MPTDWLIKTLDIVGTVVFALSGATLGAQRGLDLFGVLVLAFVTAVSGGHHARCADWRRAA
jgi:uncharacterized membrane protein YeiH